MGWSPPCGSAEDRRNLPKEVVPVVCTQRVTNCAFLHQFQEPPTQIDTISFSKADIDAYQNDDNAVHPLVWRDAARCAAGLGGGAWEGATDFLETLWNLPGLVANLAIKVGKELARREVDQMLALTNEEARQRVLETANQDIQEKDTQHKVQQFLELDLENRIYTL